jgi:hypothetical protein
VRPLQRLGGLSYSWYLWHWPALVFAAALASPLSLGGRVAAVLVSLALAQASYALVESPLRNSAALTRRPARSLAMAVGVMLATVSLAALWHHAAVRWAASPGQARITRVASDRPDIYHGRCDHFGRAELVPCVYGDTTSARSVVLVGDSHAGQWFPALRAAAERAGVRLVVLTLSRCPMVDGPPEFSVRLGRLYPECNAWRRSALEYVARLRPGAVFAASASDYHRSPEAWETGTRSVLEALRAGAARVVLVLDPPRAVVDVPACVARAAWRPGTALDPDCRPRGDPAAARMAEAQARAARAVPGVESLALRDSVCDVGACGPARDGVLRYRDADHLSPAFARTFADAFAARIGDAR